MTARRLALAWATGATVGLVVGLVSYTFLEDRWWVVRYLRAHGDVE